MAKRRLRRRIRRLLPQGRTFRINGGAGRIMHSPLKRTFDIVFSLGALTVLSPVFLGISAAIRLSSPGAAVYKHTRIGRGGRQFSCYKFRSMYIDADERLNELLESDSELREEWSERHKLSDDPRITPLGNFLRKSSLDELPQFWNVLRGDLSVVGPRPLVQMEISQRLGRKAVKILSIRPGLTCFWQTSGRSDTTYAQRIQLDEKYVEDRNLWVDVQLIARTIPAMIFSRGAY